MGSLEKNLNTQLIGETGLSSTSSTVAGETAEYETMMEKIFVNMVQKALAKQQAAENQINIDNNNRAKATDIEIENKSDEDKTESDVAEGTSSGSDPGPKGGGGEVENEVEEKFPWRNALVESAKQLWQKKLVEASANETVAKKILESRQKWRGNIIAEMGEDGLWKAEHILGAIDQEHAKLISGSEDELEVEALARITDDTRWKINLYSAKPNSLPMMIKLIDECQSEDLAAIFTRFGKQWQLAAAASVPSMEVWRAECLASCSQQWQANLVLDCSWEIQARAVASVKQESLGIALSKVPQSQEWKLGVLADKDRVLADWQVELVMKEKREKVAQLIARFDSRERVEGLLACTSLEEWKINIFSKDLDDNKYKTFKEMEDWKYQMLLEVDDEERALCIDRSRSQTICDLVLAAKESWRINAICEAANGGFWVAKLISRCNFEWQSRLLLMGQRDKVEQWRLEQLPEITSEGIAANFLFNGRFGSSIPRWKFELGLKLDKCEDPLLQQKAELIFRESIPQWKVEVAAECTESWRLENLERVVSKSVGKLFMEAEEQWKASILASERELWRAEIIASVHQEWKANIMIRNSKREDMWRMQLVAPLDCEWQVKMVFFAPEVWKAEMIAKLRPDQEMRARELLECSTEVFAKEVLAGFTDVYYT